MNLASKLKERAAAGRPIRIAQVGAGKFGTMFLSQVRLTPGMHLAGLADLMPARARERLTGVGWPQEQIAAGSLDEALRTGATLVTDDAPALIAHPGIDVVIEATGDPATGIRLALAAIAHGKHVVMVNVEADALAGPLLARRAREAGVVYSLAWGDQPALICEQVDWARACGFSVVAAGKGTRYHPSYHRSNPDTVWDILLQYLPIEDRSHINPKMFNSFLDGTKSGIEMTAVCNATGLVPQSAGLGFPPATRFELANVCKPKAEGGTLEKKGVTEVVSSLYRDGTDVPHHLAMGTYVVIESESPYAAQCFKEYHCLHDKSGRYAALYRPTHMIGLELGISVASVALRGEPTGAPVCFNSDVVAVAKRPLKRGEILDGEGGFSVWGRQVPAAVSLAEGYLPLGLASDVPLTRDLAEGEPLRWTDVTIDTTADAVKVRREMEARCQTLWSDIKERTHRRRRETPCRHRTGIAQGTMGPDPGGLTPSPAVSRWSRAVHPALGWQRRSVCWRRDGRSPSPTGMAPRWRLGAPGTTARQNVVLAPFDVTDEPAAEQAVASAVRALGGLDGVVNAAGIAADIPALDTPVELFRRVLDINVTGTFIVARAAARIMKERGGGTIVNLSSVAGLRGSKGRSAYGASKGAVAVLTQVLANDLARHSIRVNAVAPGPVDTPMVKALHTAADRALWTRHIPMRRYGTPEEIAGVIEFLLDGTRSGYMTGEILAVDGGFRGAGIIAE